MKHEIIEYKGYYIETNLYGENEITVQYCGDDIYFPTIQEAKEFIDELEVNMTDIEIEIYEAEHQPTWLLEETAESED